MQFTVDRNMLAETCDAIEWGDPDRALAQATCVIQKASAPETLAALLASVKGDATLIRKCEHFNLFSKVVLLEGTGRHRWKLRLHIFEREVLEAHHHRASFCASVLYGSYKHLLFGGQSSLERSRLDAPLKPLFQQIQAPGSVYYIDYAMVHATFAQSMTVTMMLQGPPSAESFDIFDLKNGEMRSRRGTEVVNAPQEPGEKAFCAEDIDAVVQRLTELGLLT